MILKQILKRLQNDDEDWIQPAEDGVQWQALVTIVTNLWVPP
jgi:hypothetical protein